MKKFGGLKASCGILRHILREVKKPANVDIDRQRTHLNYSLLPKRHMKPYTYLKKRLGELHCMKRDDVNVMCGWIITKPKELPVSEERRFFTLCYRFLADRYGGEQNVVAAEVHKDESGKAHLHLYYRAHPNETNVSKAAWELGISRKTVRRWRDKTVADAHGEKVSAKEVLTRAELLAFHGDLQRYLDRNGLHTDVNSGITAAQGGNKTVAEMKQERLLTREQSHEQEIENLNL